MTDNDDYLRRRRVTITSTRVGPVLAIVAMCLAFCWIGTSGVLTARAEDPYSYLYYGIDRSSVPSYVVNRELTAVIHVGVVEGAAVLADGAPIESRYDPDTEMLTFTTDGDDLIIVLYDLTSDPGSIGEANLARVKHDKLWALSVNMDDGYLTQYTNGFRFLDRYGYRGSVGIVGRYPDGNPPADPNDPPHMSDAQMQDLLDHDWEIANHSYYHRRVQYYRDLGMSDEEIVDCEIVACTTALQNALPGFDPYSFFVPFGDSDYFPLVRAYNGELGFQTMGHCGYELTDLDEFYDTGLCEFGRKGIERDGSQFDAMHDRVVTNPDKRYWLRVLEHSPDDYASDLEMAIDYLYYHYGAGGTDEVWADSVATVHQYLVCRMNSEISVATPSEPPALAGLTWAAWPAPVVPPPATTTVTFQEGAESYSGTTDTYLYQWYPTPPYGPEGRLMVRANDVMRSLLRFDVSTIPETMTVTDATLHLYCDDGDRTHDSHSISIEIYGVLAGWDEDSATWNQPATGETWGQAGCMAEGTDYAPDRIGLPARTLILEGESWYTMDVTSIVGQWVASPSANQGMLLRALSTAAFETHFASSDHWSPPIRPKLEVSYAAVAPAPIWPSVLHARAVSQTQIDLLWQDNSDDESAFHIERSPNGTTGWVEIDTVAADVTSYSDTPLDCGTPYHYRVRAYRSGDGQYSDYSNVDDATTEACPEPNYRPARGTILPGSGSSDAGQKVSFATTCSDENGWQDVKWLSFSIGHHYSGADGLYAYYNQNNGRVFLCDDEGTSWQPGVSLGSATTLENARVTLHPADMSASGLGNTLTVTWTVTFKSVVTGDKYGYMNVTDDDNLRSGWRRVSDWTVNGTNDAPARGALVYDGPPEPGAPYVFSTTCSDPNGWPQLKFVSVSIGQHYSGADGLYAYYSQDAGKVYLMNDEGTGWIGKLPPGSAQTIENSHVIVNLADMSVTALGHNLTVNWSVTFKPTVAGDKSVYLNVWDEGNLKSGWGSIGAMAVSGTNEPPEAHSVSPPSGSCEQGQPVTFTTVCSDPNGWPQLKFVSFAIGTDPSGLDGLKAYYNQGSHRFFLSTDDGTGWQGKLPPGSPETIENSRVILNLPDMSVSGITDTLTIDWSVIFKPTVLGDKDIWVNVRDDFDAVTGWQDMGDWTVNEASGGMLVAPMVAPSPSLCPIKTGDGGLWALPVLEPMEEEPDGGELTLPVLEPVD